MAISSSSRQSSDWWGGEKVIAEEESSYTCEGGLAAVAVDPGEAPKKNGSTGRNILFFGWRRDIRDVLVHLDHWPCGARP